MVSGRLHGERLKEMEQGWRKQLIASSRLRSSLDSIKIRPGKLAANPISLDLVATLL